MEPDARGGAAPAAARRLTGGRVLIAGTGRRATGLRAMSAAAPVDVDDVDRERDRKEEEHRDRPGRRVAAAVPVRVEEDGRSDPARDDEGGDELRCGGMADVSTLLRTVRPRRFPRTLAAVERQPYVPGSRRPNRMQITPWPQADVSVCELQRLRCCCGYPIFDSAPSRERRNH